MNDNDTSGSERKVILTAECEAPSCEFVAVVEDPETDYDAAYLLAEHLNEHHDEIDRELAADYYGDWDREDFEPYTTDSDAP